MKRKNFIALAVAAALAAPVSLIAETRNRPRTDLQAMADDLARALGAGQVEVSGRAPSVSTRQEAVVEVMNRERAAHGLQPLRLNVQLALAAEDRMNDLYSKHYFNHVSPDGMQPFVWAERRGYNYRTIGENLATGYPTANAVVDGWMHSPGHRANSLGRDFDEVGVAVADGSPVGNYGGPTYVAIYGAR